MAKPGECTEGVSRDDAPRYVPSMMRWQTYEVASHARAP